MEFKEILLNWYYQNKRDLPWRNTLNPYHIWVSEVILQQTRVVQGLDYYHSFIKTFPTLHKLAEASTDKVMKVWQGLGYYTRARNLHKGAQQIIEQHNGEIPKTYDELLKISGIGPYSAGAIASFAFKQVVPAVDGNVYRVLSRIFGIFESTTTAGGKNYFFNLAADLIAKEAPDTFNQALLDFGALQCIPRNPDCLTCPFGTVCYAHRNNIVSQLPVKGKKIRPRNRYFYYLLIRFKGYTYIHKREGNDIWNSLYEFPLIETQNETDLDQLIQLKEWKSILGRRKISILHKSEQVKHLLSHQTIYSRYIIIKVNSVSEYLKSHYLEIPIYDLQEYSVPRLIDNFMAADSVENYFLK